jgi:hypothetical protein
MHCLSKINTAGFRDGVTIDNHTVNDTTINTVNQHSEQRDDQHRMMNTVNQHSEQACCWAINNQPDSDFTTIIVAIWQSTWLLHEIEETGRFTINTVMKAAADSKTNSTTII